MVYGILYQVRGIGYIAPIYYFLHYVQTPPKSYAAADQRMTQIGLLKAIIPTIVLAYLIPTIAMFVAPSITTRQWINGAIWQPFPIYTFITQRVLSLFMKDTTDEDRTKNPKADLPYLRIAYGFAAVTAAIGYTYARFASPVPVLDVFFKGIANPAEKLPLVYAAVKILRYDQICAFTAGGIWTILHFHDLKKAGKLQSGWAKILGIFGGATLAFGPGAAMATMWAWREEVLAESAVVPISVKRA